tara:strand:- start:265 stop:741 length:477 start_codon:yes stop_codon:yes gene_type:complete
MKNLTHFDIKGNAQMVDVSQKNQTVRVAEAKGLVLMKKETLSKILEEKFNKGNVLQIAQLAGIMATKQTSNLIPLCHPINISSVNIDLIPDKKNSCININSKVICVGNTGVEMEALMAVSTSALTIYDMCKSTDRGIIIQDIKLINKSGGKSGTWSDD